MTYRDVQIHETDLSPLPTWWRRLRCFLVSCLTVGIVGHRWRIVRENPIRAAALAHLHPLAGCDAVCVRCGTTWLDAEYLFEQREGNAFLLSQHGANVENKSARVSEDE